SDQLRLCPAHEQDTPSSTLHQTHLHPLISLHHSVHQAHSGSRTAFPSEAWPGPRYCTL
uniref:Uncharacterized protein n=1 Tax=Gouania willdenowi TaxID=441366 RepID=A0A8C5DPR9_GOUWI